jgi:hypothetical protein
MLFIWEKQSLHFKYVCLYVRLIFENLFVVNVTSKAGCYWPLFWGKETVEAAFNIPQYSEFYDAKFLLSSNENDNGSKSENFCHEESESR